MTDLNSLEQQQKKVLDDQFLEIFGISFFDRIYPLLKKEISEHFHNSLEKVKNNDLIRFVTAYGYIPSVAFPEDNPNMRVVAARNNSVSAILEYTKRANNRVFDKIWEYHCGMGFLLVEDDASDGILVFRLAPQKMGHLYGVELSAAVTTQTEYQNNDLSHLLLSRLNFIPQTTRLDLNEIQQEIGEVVDNYMTAFRQTATPVVSADESSRLSF